MTIHAPLEDLPYIYFGLFLTALILAMWIPYMARAIYWHIREDREEREARLTPAQRKRW